MLPPYEAKALIALAESMGLPPPKAIIESNLPSFKYIYCFKIDSEVGSGIVSLKILYLISNFFK